MINYSRLNSFIMSFLCTLFIGIFLGYSFVAAYLYFFQRQILYVPAAGMSLPQNYGLHQTKQVILKTEDEVEVTGWYTEPQDSNLVMIYFHGNAGNLADRTEKLKSFLSNKIGLLALSYRGYGSSNGRPSEQGIYNDARAAVNYVISQGFSAENIFLYGESLGTGVAIQMATEFENFKAIILEAPYTSIAARGKERYPFIPIDLLLKDKFDSINKIGKVKAPILIFHGYLDQVMPIHHARKMLEAANEPKEARLYENIGHTDFDHDELARITYEFVVKH